MVLLWIVKFSIKKIEKADEKKRLEQQIKMQTGVLQNNTQNGQGNGK